MKIVECLDLPDNPDPKIVYRLLPKTQDEVYYRERTDRNIGWITEEEQKIIQNSVVSVAGCGGMGAQLAEKFLRLGIGEIRITDIEVFDISNINRQFAATKSTVNKSKAFETAKMLRSISDDFTLMVYPQGICEESIDGFLANGDIVCDEIEFWAIGARTLLHRKARPLGIPVFNCNTVGFGTRLFLFTSEGMTMEKLLGFDYEEAKEVEKSIRAKTCPEETIKRVVDGVIGGLVPELPEYCINEDRRSVILERLFVEGKASIIATNPPLATGFLADHVLFRLLKSSPVKRSIAEIPEPPGYLYLDVAKMEIRQVFKKDVGRG